MAGLFCDFPHNHPGLYGLDKNRMLDGRYAASDNGTAAPVADPDTVNAPNGIVLSVPNSRSGTPGIGLRYVLPSAQATVGFKTKIYLSGLPANPWLNCAPLVSFRTSGNADIVNLTVLPDGSVAASTDLTAANQIGASNPAVIVAHAWIDIEIKVVRDASAGTLEVRVNGISKFSLTGLALGASNIGIILFGSVPAGILGGDFQTPYFKCVAIWDGTGSNNNDFLGNVFVAGHDLASDDDLEWTPSFGTDGSHLIGGAVPTNALNVTGVVSNGEIVSIGTVFYKWTSGSVNAGAPAGTSANPWLVALGANATDSIQNMAEAINASGTAGTTYSTALTAHSVVDMTGFNAGGLGVHAKDGVSTPACTETMTNGAWARTALMPGTVNDFAWVEAGNPPPSPSTFTLSDLPPDVTSVRWLEAITRGAKVDGGDGNVQTSLSPDDTTWIDGADRPYTVAQTFYDDVSELSPVTGLAWSPTEVNSAVLKINRTV